MIEVNSYKLACTIAKILDSKLAKDIIILDISNVSVLADYFVLCSAETTTQVKALTSYLRVKIKDLIERYPAGEENDLRNRWNLLDYGDVVVHVLHKEERQFYAIEKFWNQACTINMEEWIKESENFNIN
ncbi:MAG: ribosome silencing factor [bacterium]